MEQQGVVVQGAGVGTVLHGPGPTPVAKAARPALSTEVVTDLERWRALAPQWDELAALHPQPTVFHTQGWLEVAWSLVGPGHDLHVLAWRRGEQLVGALALMRRREPRPGIELGSLMLLTDPSTCNVRSDLLLRPGEEAALIDALVQHLQRWKAWDRLRLDALPEGSPLLRHWATLSRRLGLLGAEREWRWRLQRLPVEGSWDDYLATHGSHSRSHLRRERRLALELPGMAVEFAKTPDRVAVAMEEFFCIEPNNGKQGRDNYAPPSPDIVRYYHAQMLGLARVGRALVVVGRTEGRAVAVHLAAIFERRLVTLNQMFDERLRRHYVGHFLTGEMLRWAWEQGLHEVDFNGHGEHLERWRTGPVDFHGLRGWAPTARGALMAAHAALSLGPAGRLIPRRWRPAGPVDHPRDRGIPAS